VGERGGEEVHLLPAQVHDLGSPQACRKHGGVAPLAVWPPWAAVHVTASTTRASLHGKKTSLKDGKTDSRIALNGLSAAGGRGLFCVAQYATALQNRSCTGRWQCVRLPIRFTFEIFSVSGEPRTLQVGSQYYATPDDAERAGYAAIAAKGL
jgi:hypothetical protein